MTKNRASDDAADELHALVFTSVTDQIKAYKNGEIKDEDGNALPIPPALLAQAIKLLKDNGIDAPSKAGTRVDNLKDAMPNFDELEGKVVSINRK